MRLDNAAYSWVIHFNFSEEDEEGYNFYSHNKVLTPLSLSLILVSLSPSHSPPLPLSLSPPLFPHKLSTGQLVTFEFFCRWHPSIRSFTALVHMRRYEEDKIEAERGEGRGERGEGRGERGEGRGERGERRGERGEGRGNRRCSLCKNLSTHYLSPHTPPLSWRASL